MPTGVSGAEPVGPQIGGMMSTFQSKFRKTVTSSHKISSKLNMIVEIPKALKDKCRGFVVF